MPITEEQAKGYKIIGKIVGELLLIIGSVVVLFLVTIHWMHSEKPLQMVSSMLMEAIPSGSIYAIIKNYFPQPKRESHTHLIIEYAFMGVVILLLLFLVMIEYSKS